ncbi:MAG TPA: protein kinase, partial [Kofleriaceae bacterium]
MESESSNPFALSPGSRIDKYEVLRRIAIGGMAEIYLVRVTGAAGFEKLMVLKRILPSVAENARLVEMFLDEARLAATLRHPNIADVLDVGESGGSYFFTMEYVHGQDVRTIRNAARERDEIVPLPFILAIVVGAASALHYAHTKLGNDGKPLGLVHRDVSASNVMVSYDGAVKLLDFGIARARSSTHTTQTGSLKGKAPYMSPEQCRMRPLDRRSDLFSLGVILFELTVGRRPFRGVTPFEIMEQIVNSVAPRPSELVHGYPPDLEAMVMKLLEPVPHDRYASAEELLYDLDTFVRTHAQWQSSRAISRYMRELFADRIEAWEQAQEAGVPFAEHVARTITSQSLSSASTTPVPELEEPSPEPVTTPESRNRISEPIAAFKPLRPVRRSTPVPLVPQTEQDHIRATAEPTIPSDLHAASQPIEPDAFAATSSTIEPRLLAETEPLLAEPTDSREELPPEDEVTVLAAPIELFESTVEEPASSTTMQSLAAGAEPTIRSALPPVIAATRSTTPPERTIETSPPPPFAAATRSLDATNVSNVRAPEVTGALDSPHESEMPTSAASDEETGASSTADDVRSTSTVEASSEHAPARRSTAAADQAVSPSTRDADQSAPAADQPLRTSTPAADQRLSVSTLAADQPRNVPTPGADQPLRVSPAAADQPFRVSPPVVDQPPRMSTPAVDQRRSVSAPADASH